MKNEFGLYENSFKLILKVLSQYHDIDKAFIFGSRAIGNYKKGSDIDIAITGNNIKENTALELASQLNERENIPYYCDVIIPLFVKNQNLVEHINQVGKIFYEKKKNHTRA